MSKKKNVVILGSTGSVGCNTLAVINANCHKYQVFALVAHSNLKLIIAQCLEFKPRYIMLTKALAAEQLLTIINHQKIKVEVLVGVDNLLQLVAHSAVDIVMSAMVGSVGLLPTYHSLLAKKKVLLANKESLIVGGAILKQAIQYKNQLVPVDSEHSAIFQCLENDNRDQVKRLILTASGGPFRSQTQKYIAEAKAAEAIKHPNWNMGTKISVDSATMMNKGLELIEAYWLFDFAPDQLTVIVHPQSIIHSMVEYMDGSILAQLGVSDMKIAIAYALGYPQRINSQSAYLTLEHMTSLTFAATDTIKFPCLELAYQVLKTMNDSPIIMNAANEVAVNLYLKNQIKFYDINRIISLCLDYFPITKTETIEEIIELDHRVKLYAATLI